MFGLIADGLWSATLIWGLAGIGFAGAYMPGLKALADRLPDGGASRSITLYTGSFSIGVGLSFLVSQLVADAAGWRAAFYAAGVGPFIMVVVCLWLAPCKPGPSHGHLLDFRPVLRNRAALGYILGYGAHCFELYGMRTWIVAFWTFVLAQSDDSALLGPITVSVIVTLLSLPASVLGNEAALRFGRHRAISAVMVASAAVALAIRPQRGIVASAIARARPHLRRNHSRRLGRTYVRHDRKRHAGLSWGDSGTAFDRGIRPFRAGWLGCGCGA